MKGPFSFSPYSSQPLAWSTLFSPIPHLTKLFSGVPSQLPSSCHPFSLFLQPSYYPSYPFYSLNTWFFAETLGLLHLQFCLPRMLFLWLFYLVLAYILPAKLKGTFSGIIYMTALFKGRSYSLPIILCRMTLFISIIALTTEWTHHVHLFLLVAVFLYWSVYVPQRLGP